MVIEYVALPMLENIAEIAYGTFNGVFDTIERRRLEGKPFLSNCLGAIALLIITPILFVPGLAMTRSSSWLVSILGLIFLLLSLLCVMLIYSIPMISFGFFILKNRGNGNLIYSSLSIVANVIIFQVSISAIAASISAIIHYNIINISTYGAFACVGFFIAEVIFIAGNIIFLVIPLLCIFLPIGRWVYNKSKIIKSFCAAVLFCVFCAEGYVIYRVNSYVYGTEKNSSISEKIAATIGKKNIVADPNNSLKNADDYFGRGASKHLNVIGDYNNSNVKTIVDVNDKLNFVQLIHQDGKDYVDVYLSYALKHNDDAAKKFAAAAIVVATKDGYRTRFRIEKIQQCDLVVVRTPNGKATTILAGVAQEMQQRGLHLTELSTADNSGNVIPDDAPEFTKRVTLHSLANSGYDVSVNGRKIMPSSSYGSFSPQEISRSIAVLRSLGDTVSTHGHKIECRDFSR